METGQTTLAFVSEEMIQIQHIFRPNRPGKLPAGIEIAPCKRASQASF